MSNKISNNTKEQNINTNKSNEETSNIAREVNAQLKEEKKEKEIENRKQFIQQEEEDKGKPEDKKDEDDKHIDSGLSFIEFNIIANTEDNLFKSNPTGVQMLSKNIDNTISGPNRTKHRFFFINNIKLQKEDFRGIKRTDLLNLLMNPLEFHIFMKKIIKRGRGIFKGESGAYETKKKEPSSKIISKNAKKIIDLLFKSGLSYYLQGTQNEIPYVILSHDIEEPDDDTKEDLENKRDYYYITKDSRYGNKVFKKYIFTIYLDLDSKDFDKISSTDFKKASCNSKKNKISRICSSLPKCKDLKELIHGDGKYKREFRTAIAKTIDVTGEYAPTKASREEYLRRQFREKNPTFIYGRSQYFGGKSKGKKKTKKTQKTKKTKKTQKTRKIKKTRKTQKTRK